jgi:hypothetical protein
MSGGMNNKVLIATLWQRTSERGNEYLSGFLGKARVIGFRGEPTADGFLTWDLYLQPGKEQEERAETRWLQPRPPSAASDRGHQARRVQRWAKPERERLDPDGPFHDDDISDIGKGR